MKIFSFSDNSAVPCALCPGRFDGLHLGHRALIAKAKEYKNLKTALFTIKSPAASKNIFDFDELIFACETLGVNLLVAADATADFFSTSPEDFLSALIDRFCVKALICGEDFTYGRLRAGNAYTLEKFCKERGIAVSVVKTVKKDGKKISSSAVKELLSSGDVDKAAELLGSAFKIAGRVERGRSDGAKLGFKTANLQYPADKAEIMRGVYATKTVIDGVTYPSLTNVGAALTFGLNNTLVETHVIGFDGEIYGKTISVSFVKFLRENRKFSSAEELKKQIEKDLKFYD